jgi:flavin reductase (DIM6/NTAB) family NADH-FMN oxidoreductase RutF
MNMDPRSAFIDAMSRAASGVTVVTTAGPAGRFGQTVSAMCSVTADPPTLLVCIKSTSVIVSGIREHQSFGVNLLRADQRRVADSFAGRSTYGAPYDFDSARWDTLKTEAPLLVGAVGRFDCKLSTVLEVGSHTVLFGEVQAADSSPGTPLLYARRSYGEHVNIPRQGQDTPLDLDIRLVDEDLFGGELE